MEDSIIEAKKFMGQFASITGLNPEILEPNRYLWTDAFAVCNYLELYSQTEQIIFLKLAQKLIDQVHHVLGKYRSESSKIGWISGLDKEEGENHPTIGGLRIGKEIDERKYNEPFNERLEWDRDGQYYHYLTKWMHALNKISSVTGDNKYIKWSLELAKTAQAHFTYYPNHNSNKRMYWKMSIDLKRPLVPSMGQHDPLDGFITYNEIQKGLEKFDMIKSPEMSLINEIDDMKDICRGMGLITDDPLGLGGLLSDATILSQLILKEDDDYLELLKTVLDSSIIGLRSYTADNPMEHPAEYRLAFRELGLSIGLKGIGIITEMIEDNKFSSRNSVKNRLNALKQYIYLGNDIENFWLVEKNRQTRNWKEHKNINTVMLATSLAPQGFLKL
jgi:hypothetical protein